MHIHITHLLLQNQPCSLEKKMGRVWYLAEDCRDNPALCLIEVQPLQWPQLPKNNALEVDDTFSIRGLSD